jgi:hypothetical protein
MKSSHKSALFIYSAIIFAVMLLLPLAVTTWTGANLSAVFNSAASSAHTEANLNATVEPAMFATYTVNSLTDTGAGSGTTGDLRYCITQANAAGGTDTINFSVTGTITLTSALPSISDDLIMNGPGASLLTISGNNAVRIFTTGFFTSASFSNLTIANGNASDFGGGIHYDATGTLNITNCVIRNCSALLGAGIYCGAAGTINITGSTIRNNSASASGGGIFNNVGGRINITGSTVNNNSAGSGAGLYNNDNSASRINITNSTFSSNSTTGNGFAGGFYSGAGIHTVTNCTFTGNSSNFVGGIYRSAGTITLKNSIVAQNSGGSAPDLNGTFTSAGYNLISNNSSTSSFTAGMPNANKDYVGTSGSPINAQLAALGNYGGLTQTHDLLSNSLAIDHGSAATGVTTDQRGVSRPIDNPAIAAAVGGNNSDIGAVESGAFVFVGGNITCTPAAAPPAGTVRMNVSTSTNFTGTLAANPITGLVRVTNASPAGTYTITVKAFNSMNVVTTSTFTLVVTTPANNCASSTFSSAANVGTGVNACSVAVADFNNDGLQDLAIATNTGDDVAIRLGNGTGGFTGSTNVPVGPASHPGHGIQPNQVVIGDFNRDGNQDFATSNINEGTVSIRLGDGAGNFTGETSTSEIALGVSLDANSLAVGDFNSDGKQDLAVANPFSSTISILLGDGLGAFPTISSLSADSPQFVVVGDFNNDGKQDLVAATFFDAVQIFLGDGLGGFGVPTYISTGDRPRGIAIGDFNNDGKQDFLTANTTDSTVSVRLGNGLGGFTGSTDISAGTTPYSVAAGDFNNDGKLDFVTANYNGNSSSVRYGDGLGGFSGSTNVSVGSRPISVAMGDFNNDKTLDFATANVASNNASVRLGSCDDANMPPTINAGIGVSRQQGSPASNSQIATVNDAESGASAVTVTVTSANPSNGVTLSNIVNSNGNVTADVVASCTATDASFTLQASDGSKTATATLSITVTANTAPTVTYSNQTVAFGGSLNVNVASATDNGSISSYAIQSVTPSLTTAPTVNSSGRVSITNARPTGDHVITVRATDNCGATTDASFTVTVGPPPPTITASGALSRQKGSPATNSQIATVSDANQAAETLTVTATPASGSGVTISGISVDATGKVTANVVAACTSSNSTFTLRVTNNQSATATATLTVNTTANVSPTQGNYSTTNVNVGSGTTVTPSAAPTDNGTISSLTASTPSFTGTFSGNTSTGVITVTNAGPAGTYTVTVTATDNCNATSTKTFTLNVNTPPTINGATISRQQGSASSNSQIATVNDNDQTENTLVVTATPLTGTGVTISSISTSAAGSVTANVVASCTATDSTFTLTVTDNKSATATATLTVNVTANAAPTLGNYSTTNLSVGGGTTVTPSAAPSDNGTISSLTASAPGFTGTFSGNTSTGVITVTNAGPAGSYTVTVTATDNCNATSTKTFTLNVNTPPTINSATISRQQGSPGSVSQIATVNDADQTENTLGVSATPLTGTGVTVSGISVDAAGNVTATVVASCTATNSTFTLTATDNLGATATATLTVNVSANTAPVLGSYSTTNTNAGATINVMPSVAPTDNGTISSLTGSAPGFTGTFSGNPLTGVITVTNAGPAGSYSVTVSATDNCGATSTTTFTLNVNAIPTISGATISRQQGSPASISQIATVNDADQAANTLSVGATPLTGTGVTVSGISVDAAGNVTASVLALCTATNSTFTVTVTDSQGTSASATLTINVVANTAPVPGNYSAIVIGVGNSTTVTPSAAPTDNGMITSIVASAPGFAGNFNVDPASGVVTVTNAGPNGSYTVTVTATDNCGATGTKTFTLDVGCLTYTVNSLSDTGAGSGATGDLRYCITQANSQLCDTIINFSVTGVINLTSALPALNNNITFNGPGAGLLDVHRNSSNAFRIFTVNGNKTVAINGLKISNGQEVHGGAIENSGSLTIANCIFADNIATVTLTVNDGGGAIFNTGTLTITGCTFTENHSDGSAGGAIYNAIDGKAYITGSTLSNNIACLGGAIHTVNIPNDEHPGILTVTDSTFYGNQSGVCGSGQGGAVSANNTEAFFTNCTFSDNDAQNNRGGGIAITTGMLTLLNCTVTGNGVNSNSGGLFFQDATVHIKNSIVAGNTGMNLNNDAGRGTLDDQGNNILSGNPMLAPLGNYGGATQTHALCNNSPAVNAGNNTGAPAKDQRGVNRPFGTNVDIGAFEANITVNPGTLPAGTLFVAYPSQTFTASGGSAPYAITLIGTLPQGMNFSSGTLSGTPTETGNFTIIVIATGGDGFAGAMCYTLTINCPTITLSPSVLPGNNLNAGYNQTITASGGNGSYRFAVSDGSLPTGLTLSLTGLLSGTTTAGGTFNFTVTATDDTNCTGSQTYTVIINTPPNITAVAPLSRERDTSISALQIATVTDLEQAVNTLSITATPLSGSGVSITGISVDATGKVTATVAVSCTATNSTFTLTVTDAQGLTATTILTVNVTAETKAPVISCPANITQSTDNNLCTAIVNFTVPTATDNCGSASVVCNPPSGSAFAKGVTTVTCTATDPASNTASCTFTVTVNDTQKPTVTCPANIVKSTDPNVCTAVVTYTNPTANDNCSGTTVACNPPSGSTFAKGVTTVTCTATDASNNTSTPCTFTVTVNDTQNPTVTCPANIVRNNDTGVCTAVVTYTTPTASDNCSGATVVCSPPSGTTFSKGVTTVTCTATDASNNTGSCTFTVTINDTQNPTINCPANITVNTTQGNCSAPVSFTVGAADNCTGVGTPTCTPPSGSTFPKGTTTVNCSVNDASSNSASCSFTVTVNDNQNPTVACPQNITTNTAPGSCAATVTYVTPTANDNCPGATVVCLPASGTSFAKGTTTVTCTATDQAGLTGTCSFTVTVVDMQAPTVTCPANIVRNNDSGTCSAVVTYTTPQASDNCSGATVVCNPPSGTAFPKGVTTVICTATDASNNTGSCSFTVTVNDTQKPSITCPANVTTPSDGKQCTTVVNYATPQTSDNCPGTINVSCTPPSGSTFTKGVTTVNCTATDTSNNSSSCSFTVTVTDMTAPTITCPANITKTTDANQCSAVVTFTATASDNCPGATTSCTPPSGTAFGKGVTTVNCQATDANGNQSAMCSFTVTVNDAQNPAFSCPANITKPTDANQCSAVVNYTVPVATDNCPNVGTVTCVPPTGSAFPKGVTTVTCTVRDASQNQTSCSFTVTVNDTQAPSIVTPANMIISAAKTCPIATSTVVTYAMPTISDNCPGASIACLPPSGSSFPIGATVVNCTATDGSSNTTACSFQVMVYNACVQDDSNPGKVLLWNTVTGEYRFCCDGTVYTGVGTVTLRGCVYMLAHNTSDRRLSGKMDLATFKGDAGMQTPAGSPVCSLIDRDVRDNSCLCQ